HLRRQGRLDRARVLLGSLEQAPLVHREPAAAKLARGLPARPDEAAHADKAAARAPAHARRGAPARARRRPAGPAAHADPHVQAALSAVLPLISGRASRLAYRPCAPRPVGRNPLSRNPPAPISQTPPVAMSAT